MGQTFRDGTLAACRFPRRARSMILARSYSAIMPCTCKSSSSSGVSPSSRFKKTTSTPPRRNSSMSKTWWAYLRASRSGEWT